MSKLALIKRLESVYSVAVPQDVVRVSGEDMTELPSNLMVREAFERWAKEWTHFRNTLHKQSPQGVYLDHLTETAWQAFQAGLRATPEPRDGCRLDTDRRGIRAVPRSVRGALS